MKKFFLEEKKYEEGKAGKYLGRDFFGGEENIWRRIFLEEKKNGERKGVKFLEKEIFFEEEKET